MLVSNNKMSKEKHSPGLSQSVNSVLYGTLWFNVEEHW